MTTLKDKILDVIYEYRADATPDPEVLAEAILEVINEEITKFLN